MARKRQGRAGFFKGMALTRQTQAPPVADPQAALATLRATLYEWDLDGDALSWGPNAATVLGIPADALPRTGQALAALVEPGSGTDDRNAEIARPDAGATFDLRYALRFGVDHVVMVRDSGRRLPDGRGAPRIVQGLLRAEEVGADMLPAAVGRRTALLGRLNHAIAEALRFSHSITLILGRVETEADGTALDGLARCLRPMLRRHDVVRPLGPDRFAVVLASCAAWDAGSAMRRLSGLAAGGGLPVRLGAAAAPDHALDATELLRLAEQALDRTCTGPETAILHEPRRRSSQPAAPRAEADPLEVVHALNGRRLGLSLRPTVDALTRQPILSQAAPFLSGEEGGTGGPLLRVPALKGANLPFLVDARLLELAADHLARLPEARLSLPVAPATFRDGEWLPALAAHLGARPGIASRLLVEVPESLLRHPGATRGRLDALKALGVGIVLSGFGSGYASLAHLRHLPVDILKLDGRFAPILSRSMEDRLFVRRLVDLAQHLGIATLADGVDDEPCARRLADWGVDYLAGAVAGGAEPLPVPGLPPQSARRA
ncbi:EAL domain-containing protein [Microvirga thermotolerans]|uniref:EAL domain-containing protein n=1 Tax=Microvirga thermotolerans TaxID=2651334 RepID=A0A5P9K248_9HYPH|nr:GGDEF domain-containing protein [Microvirga thermotolerans]QFU17780.1 EAL domain-containing protein [Microvirga thermotolerans]